MNPNSKKNSKKKLNKLKKKHHQNQQKILDRPYNSESPRGAPGADHGGLGCGWVEAVPVADELDTYEKAQLQASALSDLISAQHTIQSWGGHFFKCFQIFSNLFKSF